MSKHMKSKWESRGFARGFTLIELMVVVAVIAILASIAYPSYQDAVRKSKRAQVKADMAELAQRYERFHTVNNTYVGFWAVAAGGAPGNAPGEGAKIMSPNTTGATVAYQISSSGEAANAFTLTAAPQGRQQRDTLCGTLTLTHTGSKSESGTGNIADCW